jgi:hypothetical protein
MFCAFSASAASRRRNAAKAKGGFAEAQSAMKNN